MPFITNANFRGIFKRLDLKGDKFEGDVYDGLIKNDTFWKEVFNGLECRQLLAYKDFLIHPADFVGYYKRVEIKDTLTYVREGIQPCYHLKYNCEYLNAPYENFRIPKNIRDLGGDEVKKFREVFNQNYYLIDSVDKRKKNRDLFMTKVLMVMNVTSRLKKKLREKGLEGENLKQKMKEEIESIKKELIREEHNNSGVQEIDNPSLADIEDYIKNLVDEMINYCVQSPRYRTILYDYRKRAYLYEKILIDNRTSYPEKEIKYILKEFTERYKLPLQEALKTYYRVKYNPQLEFKQPLLEELGFKMCSYCSR